VARKPNYDFERRKKEMERKARKEAKREERLRRKEAGLPDDLSEYGVNIDALPEGVAAEIQEVNGETPSDDDTEDNDDDTAGTAAS
jgi:hypothetical protein